MPLKPQRTAVITGATGGVGAALAAELARKGWHLILTGSGARVRSLHALARELRETCRVDVDVRILDPEDGPAVDALAHRLATLPVDLLVNGAGGEAPSGPRADPRAERRRAAAQVAVPLKLTYAVLPGMLRRGTGGIVQAASAGALLRTFLDTLAADLADTGVRIRTLPA